MKLSACILKVDTGFAPNPFGRYCTLACCKPTIRRYADVGDIIVGTASASSAKPSHLIYAMRVKCILPYQDYWNDPRFAHRRPSPKTSISRRGDNIWHQVKGDWKVSAGAFHDRSHQDRDTSGENALVATEFYYFGASAIRVPNRFKHLRATTQGHKNTIDATTIINQFWDWIGEQAQTYQRRKRGRLAAPMDFTEDARLTQCREMEDDDKEVEQLA